MGLKLGNFLLISNMLQYKMDEFYLYYIYITEIFSLYFLAVAFSAEMIRWMRFEQRIASSFLQYTPEAHMKKNTLKKEGFVLYEVFLLLVFLVMAGQSFTYILNHKPANKTYLDEKLLFLDPTCDIFIAFIYPLMSIAFILLGVLMVRRLKNYNKRYSMLIPSVM